MAEKNTLNKFKEEERERRKQLIIDAAKRVFSSKPYDNANMREIAEEAGIATSSIYTYFPNQESLFVEAAIGEICNMTNILRSIVENIPDPEEKLEVTIDTFIDYISKHDYYFRMMVLFMTHGDLNKDALEKLNNAMRYAFTLFDEIFEDIGYPGNIRKLSHYLFAVLNGILVTYRKLPERTEGERLEHMKDLGKIMKDLIISKGKTERKNE